MNINPFAPWHKASYNQFLNERLPQLLAERLPLAGYQVESTSAHACRITLTLCTQHGEVQTVFADLHQPDTAGIFLIDGKNRVLLPVASTEELDVAEIKCVGEQIHDYIESQLGQISENLPADEALVRSLVPLDVWFYDFLCAGTSFEDYADGYRGSSSQAIDSMNYLSRKTHLRRILIPNAPNAIACGQFGRVCPFETPEGPNIGRALTIAIGAEIRDGKILITDSSPEAGLGLTASMVPFLEHNDANRQLMGVNMMRQWQVPTEPEPALVQTGNEINEPGFWCGFNLLTAFLSWGVDTYEDAILISESCAKRFNFDHPIEPGDKISNRHGSKGTISRIVPDSEMPHLSDGTPVELVYNFIGIHARLNFGQIREAIMGRIAKAEGAPAIVPPFHAPSADVIRARLEKNGLPESGMEVLRKGKNGPDLERPSTVGYVYWGRTVHDVRDKIHTFVSSGKGLLQGELEYYALRDSGAYENIKETYNTRSSRRSDGYSLSSQVAAGPVYQAPAPTPWFEDLERRLRAAGIKAELKEEKLSFSIADPEGNALFLAVPMQHPWLRERELKSIGALVDNPLYQAVVDANRKVERLLASKVPETLSNKAIAQLRQSVQALFDNLIRHSDMRLFENNLFSGRSVIIPGGELQIDQIGLPEEMAWDLFGPMVAREMMGDADLKKRSKKAIDILDKLMEESWVIINRAPSFWYASLLAFHSVRIPGRAIRLHPLACYPLNADYDGDMVSVFLPITKAAQREAGERLSIAAHLVRKPDQMLPAISINQDMIWGLAELSRTDEGRNALRELADINLIGSDGFATTASVRSSLREYLNRKGTEKTLRLIEQLMRLGFQKTLESGASLSPFIGESIERPPLPATDAPEEWMAYSQELADIVASRSDYGSPDLGPQLLAVKSGARGSIAHLLNLAGIRGAVICDIKEHLVPIRHGLAEGMTSEEAYNCVPGARIGLARSARETATLDAGSLDAYGVRRPASSQAFTVLARAMRAPNPGPVFTRAAAIGEIDPLTDLDTRLFLGLEVNKPQGRD